MGRLVGFLVALILLGGCANSEAHGPAFTEPSPGPWPSASNHPTTSAKATVVERQVDRKPVVPRRFYSRRVGSATVVPLHLEGNTLVPPDDPRVLGWWGRKAGSTQGVTLLVGHTVHRAAWKIYGKGRLDNLEEVALGTDINVSGVHYTVSSVRIISKAALAREAPHLFSQRGSHRLVVVTCEDYDPTTGHYGSNVVLVAK